MGGKHLRKSIQLRRRRNLGTVIKEKGSELQGQKQSKGERPVKAL